LIQFPGKTPIMCMTNESHNYLHACLGTIWPHLTNGNHCQSYNYQTQLCFLFTIFFIACGLNDSSM